MSSKSRAALALALCLPLLHACGGNSTDAQVRLVNATTDYAAMSFYDGTDELTSSVASNTVSGYSGLDAGTYTFNVRNSTSTSTAASVSQTVAKETHYTVVAYVNGGTTSAVALTEDEDSPDSGYAKLRILNAAAAESAAIDVYATTNDCSALTTADTALATDVTGLDSGFNEVSAASSGTSWHVCVTGYQDKTDLRLDIPAMTLKNGEIATLIVTKSTGGFLMNGLLLQQQGDLTNYANPDVRIRLVADAASSGTVSATVNGTALGGVITSPAVGSYVLVSAGALTTDLTINGTSVTQTGLTTTAGGDYSLLVAGTVGSPTVNLLTDDNTPSVSSTKSVKLRFVNGLNGIGGAAMLTDNGTVIGDSVAFGTASSYVNVAAAAAAADLQASYAGTVLWEPSTLQTLTSSDVYTVFLLGDTTSVKGYLRADNN